MNLNILTLKVWLKKTNTKISEVITRKINSLPNLIMVGKLDQIHSKNG